MKKRGRGVPLPVYTATPHPTVTINPRPPQPLVRKATLFSFVFVMYSYTTGGPFGLEDQVSNSGPGMTLLYHLLIPFFWCIPISLVAAELTTAMPVQGGFYRWVRAAFGDFWGFLAGWWNWTASFLLGSVYAVLFADYLGFYFPQLTGRNHYFVAAALIAVIAYINVRGIQMVGRLSTLLEIFVLLPIAVMVVMGLAHWKHNPFVPIIPPHKPLFQVFGVGLALGVWLYSGYEQLSTVAEEVDNPRRTFPRALALVVPLSIATYFLPTFASLAALDNWQQWHSDYFSVAAKLIGGPLLGAWVALAAMVANAALLNSTVLATTRMPFALAEDGFFPRAFTRIHPRYGTPALAIVVSAVIYAAFAMYTLTQLISVYAWLRVATSVMTVLSAWKLRQIKPEMPRPFIIPGGRKGLLYAALAPVLLGILATAGSVADSIHRNDRLVLLSAPAAILLGPLAYAVSQEWRRRDR
jgi:amino acid transporter